MGPFLGPSIAPVLQQVYYLLPSDLRDDGIRAHQLHDMGL